MKKKGLAAIILSICFVFVAAYAVIDVADNAAQPQTAGTEAVAQQTTETATVSEQAQSLAAEYTADAKDADNEKRTTVFDQYLDSAVTLDEAEKAAEQTASNDIVTMLMEQKMNKDKGQTVASKQKDTTDPDEPYDVTNPEDIEEGNVVFSDETLMIKFKNSFNGKVNDALKDAGVEKLEVIFEMEGATWYTAYLNEKADAQESLAAVREIKKVEVAEYNYQYETTAASFDEAVQKNPQSNNQDHHKQCQVKDAWKVMDKKGMGGGDSSVVVAVIDTGVDYNHEDLRANMWINNGEVDGNGIDDDSNGYVDDYYGVDMTAGNGSGNDDNGHGTHVAGIIAASNNKTGIVGIAYNTKIMTVKAGDASGYFHADDIASAVLYAYDNGADVINMSFGGSASSIAVQDALATAYSRCVLVASAGNDGEPNEVTDYDDTPKPNYPAALSYVLGVMSVDSNYVESSFTNWDTALYNSVEYEVYAPGGQILSTIPGNKYAKMSGTSMAAPVVAAQAAIIRSYYDDRDKYPTKFIYGQIVGTADNKVECINPEKHAVNGELHNIPGCINFHDSLVDLPTPDIGMSDYTLFDTAGYTADTDGITAGCKAVNNEDGIVDAGETIALGMTLKNRWGMSENTTVSIDTISNGGVENPYVTILNNNINYGSVGTYSESDSGKIKTDDMWTGWENPFYIKIDEDCPNDYSITLNVTITYENGLDESDRTIYESKDKIVLTVRNGVVLPSIIEEDTTLTKDNYYILENSVLVKEGVTLRIEEGTQVQFWCSDPEESLADTAITYLKVAGNLICEGTEEEPIEMFPSGWMDQYRVEIYISGNGYASMKYTNVVNPYLTIDKAENCEFTQNYNKPIAYRYLSSGIVKEGSAVGISNIENVLYCAFYKLGHYGTYPNNAYELKGNSYNACIFVDSRIKYSAIREISNCIFYGNNVESGNSELQASKLNSDDITVDDIWVCNEKGKLYFTIKNGGSYIRELGASFNLYDRFAKELGGEILSINDNEEWTYITNKLSESIIYGYKESPDGKYYNYDGTELINAIEDKRKTGYILEYILLSSSGLTLNNGADSTIPYKYLIEVDSEIHISEIELEDYVVNMDTEDSYQIEATVTPTTADAATLIYESEDESIATVDANGLVTPIAQGSTNIRVYAPDRAVYNYVTVNIVEEVIPTAITAKKSEVTLAVGSSIRATVDFTPVDATKKKLAYESEDTSIATVNERGVITAGSVGETTITITGYNDIKTTVVVNCVIPADSIAFEEDVYVTTLDKEDGTDFYPVITPVDSTQTELEWTSSNPEVCYVDEEGKLIKLRNGTATLKAVLQGTSLASELYISICDQSQDFEIVKMTEEADYTWALSSAGELWIWGTDTYKTPFKIFETSVKDFVVNGDYIYIVDNNNELYRYTYSHISKMKNLDADCGRIMNNVKMLVEYNASFYVILNDGTAWSWGNNEYGRLGVGNYTRQDNPGQIDIGLKVVDIVPFIYCTFVLDEEGNVYQLGGLYTKYSVPTLITTGAEKIYCQNDDYSYVYIDKGNRIEKWTGSGKSDEIIKEKNSQMRFHYGTYYIDEGIIHIKGTSNEDGKYGVGHKESIEEFVKVTGPRKVSAVYVFSKNMYIQTEDGSMYATGDGNRYGLANANLEDSYVPVKVYFGLTNNYEELELEGTNLVGDNTESMPYILNSKKLDLNFNESIGQGVEYSKIVLNDSKGNIMGLTKKIELDSLSLLPKSGFVEGEVYTLTIPNNAISSRYGLGNEEIVLTFIYHGNSSAGSEDASGEEEKVIHESVVDEDLMAARDKWTEATISEAWEKFVEGGHNTRFYSNVILNRLSDDDVSTWLRITAPDSSEYQTIGLGGNYWGTTNKELINKQILDFNDYQSLADINEGEILTEAPSNTYPFVVDAYLELNGEKTDTVGNDLVTFVVDFNRAMDTSIDLNVAFGSAYPYADYTVEGEWATDKQWRGTMQLNTIIENGYQYWSVSNGKATGTSLKLYKDWGRFPFLIDTSAAQALIMDAEPTENGINLTWTQDEFETLAGYNVYRSTTEDGLYEKINKTVIPADTKTFFDENVIPGQKYYYNFTVVETDLTESEPSGKVIVTAFDTMAPDIYHSPVYNAFTGSNLVISATVTDNVAIQGATLYYRTVGAAEWKSRAMTNNNDKYSAVIGSADITVDGLEYYIEATDGISETYKGTADDPFVIAVQVAVAASAKGDVDGNGAVEVADAMMVLQAINDRYNMTAEEFARADLDDSEELEAHEALRILQYVNGTIGSIL